MKKLAALTLALSLGVIFQNQASASSVVQILNCKLKNNASKPHLSVPRSIGITLTEDLTHTKLLVNGVSSRFSDEESDEGFETVTFNYSKNKIRAVFSYGGCDNTRVGSVGAEVVTQSTDDFSGNQNLDYDCRCLN